MNSSIKLSDFIKSLKDIESVHGGDIDIYLSLGYYDYEKHLMTTLPIAVWYDTSNMHDDLYETKEELLELGVDEFTKEENIKLVVVISDYD